MNAAINASLATANQATATLQAQVGGLAASLSGLNGSLLAHAAQDTAPQQSLSVAVAGLNASLARANQGQAALNEQVAGLSASFATLNATLYRVVATFGAVNFTNLDAAMLGGVPPWAFARVAVLYSPGTFDGNLGGRAGANDSLALQAGRQQAGRVCQCKGLPQC